MIEDQAFNGSMDLNHSGLPFSGNNVHYVPQHSQIIKVGR